VCLPIDADDYDEEGPFGQCMKAKGEVYDWHRGHSLNRGLLADERNAIPTDGSGYHAALITRDRFGCVDFGRKDGKR
jgi:hypothetical protein